MKVCTDSCIFGAYVAMQESDRSTCSTILDVGTGTGLLSLMLVQKCIDARVDAIETEEGAFLDCKDNFDSSPWANQLTVQNIGYEQFQNPEGYDLVICNPPFFLDHLKSPEFGRNASMHNTAQNWKHWLQKLVHFCKPEGKIWLLLDVNTWNKTKEFLPLVGLWEAHNLQLIQTKGRIWRNIVCLTKQPSCVNETLIVDMYSGGRLLNSEISYWLVDYYL